MSLLLVNVLFAVLAMGIGFVAGAWFLGGRSAMKPGNDPPQEKGAQLDPFAFERAVLASGMLRDLAGGIASDVGAHSRHVQQISDDLRAAESADDSSKGDQITSAIAKILTANESLQERLEKAERQIEAQAAEIRTHESEARTDSLTQISNRRAFDDEVRRRHSEWQRKKTPFSLLILDVDHFKKFNDTHGHPAGDEVLRSVARALKAVTRDMDLPCRYGGEEFAIVLPATVAPDAAKLAERVRQAVERLTISFENKSLSVTCSVGVAQVSSEDTEAMLLKRADDALYRSKGAGRNCSHLHTGNECVLLTSSAAAASATAPASVSTKVLDSLPNRTKFAEDLRRRVAESTRTGVSLTVLAIDVDRFSEIHRVAGEGPAKGVLEAVATFLRSILREMDLLGTLSDGRFVAMLPCSTIESARTVGNRAVEALAKCSLPLPGKTNLKIVIGAAELAAGDTAASLIERAEASLRSGEMAAAAAEKAVPAR